MTVENGRFGSGSEKKTGYVFFLVCLFFICALLMVGNFRIAQKRKVMQAEFKILENKITAVSSHESSLQKNIVDDSFSINLERIAREELGLQEEGEKVVAFPAIENLKEQPKTTDQKGFWQRLLERITK